MADHLTPAERSRNMAAIRSKDTKPELALRKALRDAHLIGYRVGPKGIPGRPDVAFTRWRLAVFVDGAYWHGHPDHFNALTASAYWREKIAKNRARDELTNALLVQQGWRVLRFWDFEVLRSQDAIACRIGQELTALGRNSPPCEVEKAE